MSVRSMRRTSVGLGICLGWGTVGWAQVTVPPPPAVEANATAEPNATEVFLGREQDWSRCGVSVDDIHALFGGTAIYLEGSGACLVRIVARADEQRFSLTLAPRESLALRRACIDADLLTVPSKGRPGAADEASPTIVLRNADGQLQKRAKWANDKVARFDQVYDALLALRKKTKGLKPEYAGPRQHNWRPPAPPALAAGTKTSMKGWELYLWQEQGELQGALLEGTNRLKTDAEIRAATVKGLEALKPQLAQLKAGEIVTLAGRRLADEPPADAAQSLREHGRKLGLKMQR